jgi:hypothetical protein
MKANLGYVAVLVVVFVVGLLSTTPVAAAVLKYAALNLSFLTSAYSAVGLAIGSAVSVVTLGTVSFPQAASSLSLPSWVDSNTVLGGLQATISAVLLGLELR